MSLPSVDFPALHIANTRSRAFLISGGLPSATYACTSFFATWESSGDSFALVLPSDLAARLGVGVGDAIVLPSALGTARFKVAGLLSASPGALGGLQSLSHLAPLLANLQCWVAPTRFSLSRAGEAFDADGRLASEGSRERVRAVVEQVLWASQRLHCP